MTPCVVARGGLYYLTGMRQTDGSVRYLFAFAAALPLLVVALLSGWLAARHVSETAQYRETLAEVRVADTVYFNGRESVRLGVLFATQQDERRFAQLEVAPGARSLVPVGEEMVVYYDTANPQRLLSFEAYEGRWSSPQLAWGGVAALLALLAAWRFRLVLNRSEGETGARL